MKPLAMALSQVDFASWTCVKFYQYLRKYLKGKSYVNIFFHLFKCHYGLVAQTRGQCLISFELAVCGFWPLPDLLPFVDQFFLVTPSIQKLMLQFVLLGTKWVEDVLDKQL